MYHAIVFLPLIGALIAGFGGRAIGAKASEYVTTLFLIVAALLSWVAFFTVAMGDGRSCPGPDLDCVRRSRAFDWALRVDALTAVMLVVVNTVSCLVHVYSIGYMHHDPHRPRFFAYLSFFTFAMLMLVTVGQPAADVLRLGRRGRRLLPADRLLFRQAVAPGRRR